MDQVSGSTQDAQRLKELYARIRESRAERIKREQNERFENKRKERQKAKKTNAQIKIKNSFNSVSYMRNLANASSASEVAAVVRQAQTKARFLKSTGASEKEIQAAKRAVRTIKVKGNKKIVRLRNEKSLERLADMMEKREKRIQMEQAQDELIGKRRARKAEERLDVLHAVRKEMQTEVDISVDIKQVASAAPGIAMGLAGNVVDTIS